MSPSVVFILSVPNKLCMFGYCHLKNYISLQYFDRPIFEGVIALFDLEYFIKIEKRTNVFPSKITFNFLLCQIILILEIDNNILFSSYF